MSRAAPSAGRAGAAMALGTLASRVTGLVRTAALAAALGATSLADSYNVANTVPTILLVLVTGGTLSAVLVPMLVRTDDLDERRRRAESLGALVLAVTAAATLLAVLLAPLLARFFALGLRGEPDYDAFVRVTTLLLVLFAPQVLAYGLSVHSVAVLQAAGRLALAGVAPVATNLVTIAAVALYLLSDAPADVGAVDTGPLLLLGVGTTLGVVAMTVLPLLGARRVRPGRRVLRRRRRSDAGRELLHLGRWTLLYVGANQAGLAVVLVLATSLSGGASAYQWAFALMQLPFAVVAVSVLSALYPRVARAAGQDDGARYAALLAAGLRTLLLLLVPAALALGLLAEPVVRLLLGYGAVDESGVDLIAAALRLFAVALLPFTAFQLLTRAHYARGDTRTPALVNVAVNAVNVVGAGLAVALAASAEQALAGLAAAYAASYVAGCLLLGRTVRRTVGTLAGVAGLTGRLLPAAGLAAGAILLGSAAGRGLAGEGRPGDVVVLLVAGLAGAATWVAASLLLARDEVSAVLRQLRR